MRLPDPPFWGTILPPRFMLHSEQAACLFCRANKLLAWLLYFKILVLFGAVMYLGARHALGLE